LLLLATNCELCACAVPQCGSCWAFSAVEQIESAWFLAGNPLVDFAPQQVVSCDVGGDDYACNGGDTPTAYQYIEKAGGLALETDYPYTSGKDGTDGKCNPFFKVSGGGISGFEWAVPACPAGGKCASQDLPGLKVSIAGACFKLVPSA
jgi:hypothetical protein